MIADLREFGEGARMKHIDIMRSASRLVRKLAEVEPDESVLVVTDTFSLRSGEAIVAAANRVAKASLSVALRLYLSLPAMLSASANPVS